MKRLILTIIFALVAVYCFAQYQDEYKTLAYESTSQEQVVAMASNAADFTAIDIASISKAQRDIKLGKIITAVGGVLTIADAVLLVNKFESFNYEGAGMIILGAASVTATIVGIVKWSNGSKALKRLSATPGGGLAFKF